MYAKRMSWLIFLLVSITCAYLLAKLTWQAVSFLVIKPDDNLFQSAPTQSTELNKPQTNALFSTIKQYNLFGAAFVKTTRTPLTTTTLNKPIQQTRLNIQLLGLIKGINSVAVINFEGDQSAYRESDIISNKGNHRVILLEIRTDHIVIENNGVPEKLLLPGKKKSNTGIATKRQSSPPSVNLNSKEVQKLIGGDARQVLSNNPLSLAKFLTLSPTNNNGTLQGYRINAGQDQRLLQATGLSPGDLVTQINNVPAADLEISQLFRLLQTTQTMTVTLERNGQPLTMDIKL